MSTTQAAAAQSSSSAAPLAGWQTTPVAPPAYSSSWSGFSTTAFSVCRNSAASAPYTILWSAVMLTCITLRTPIMPSAVATTVGLLPPTAMMAAVPAGTASKNSSGAPARAGRGGTTTPLCMCVAEKQQAP
eukprot:GHRQ01017735.1.p2 GENE.GHRQ01017735.1~~GHRQ01017735.1.p2  ORF type:complete len:131 (+),score=24.63 GHRQ01017735.1:926-1318(+)